MLRWINHHHNAVVSIENASNPAAVNHLCPNQRKITQPGSAGEVQRKWNAWGTGRLIRLLLWRQASIYWCYYLIWFTWLLSRPVLPVGKVSCVWWMLLSKMPRSICNAVTKKRGLSYFKSVSHVSSSLQSDLASLCNNIQREDNCWVHAHVLALIFKTGHGATEKRAVSLMAVWSSITYSKTDLEIELYCLAWMLQLCLDLSILTEGPRRDCTLSFQEQLGDIEAHHQIILQ